MLPQFLVQNSIISSTDQDFQLDWTKAAPILNLNFFHIISLVNESQKYCNFLRPWKSVSAPESGDSLLLHQYYTAVTSNATYSIYNGSWVGRVKTGSTNYLDDSLVLTPSYQYYIYDSVRGEMVENSQNGVPCIFRPNLWGLEKQNTISLSKCELIGTMWQYPFTRTPSYAWSIRHYPRARVQLTTDIVRARIILDGEIIARVPVTIQRKWNENTINYDYAFIFPNFNFPRSAAVEFY